MMDGDDYLNKLVGKKVHIKTRTNDFYNGYIKLVTKKWLLIVDKDNKPVYLLLDSLEKVEEYKEK